MKKLALKILITLALTSNIPVFAESLFKTGISQNVYTMQPRSLFSSVKAKSIGDLITIVISEQTSTSNAVKLDVKKDSTTTDNFSTLINHILPKKPIPNVNDFGGSTSTASQASFTRSSKLSDKLTAQVVQVLPNGNLVVQGKKVSVDSGERTELLISGVVDPRMLDNTGSIQSNMIANFQIAITGKGTVSRSDSEGAMNKFFKYLF